MHVLKKLTVATLMTLFVMPVVAGEGKVNINKADQNKLMSKLEGVDQTLADRIVNHRNEHGAYVALYDLDYVEGIDRSFLQSNFEKMTVGDVSLADKKHNPYSPKS